MRAICLVALLALGGCQRLETWRKPELAACESFIRSTLKSPSSYKRADFTIIDQPVSRSTLSKAVGLTGNKLLDKDVADEFVKPTIRSVLVHYDADNTFGASLRSGASCRFAVSNGSYAMRSPQDAADAAVRDNQLREVSAALKGGEAESTDCCLSKDFDLNDFDADQRKGGFSLQDQGQS